MSRRVAVVDVGSNTLKFSVTEVAEDGSQEVLDAHAETVRLGFGLDRTGKIESQRANRAIEVLKAYEVRARQIGAEAFVGVATQAMRQAANGEEVMRAIATESSWQIGVISGDEEAELAFQGLLETLPPQGVAVVVDIGGGSTEIISVRDRIRLGSVSIGIGSGGLADRVFESFPPGEAAMATAIQVTTTDLSGSLLLPIAPGGHLILSGGNGQFLEAFGHWMAPALPFSPESFDGIVSRLAVVDPAIVAMLLGISVERAQVLPAGAAIAAALMEILRPAAMTSAPSGIRAAIVARLWAAQSGQDAQ